MPQEICIMCHGRGEVRCPNPECRGGKVKDKDFRGFLLNESMRPEKDCPVCDGSGKVRCPACDGKGVVIIS